jgi:hypothetical protein
LIRVDQHDDFVMTHRLSLWMKKAAPSVDKGYGKASPRF